MVPSTGVVVFVDETTKPQGVLETLMKPATVASLRLVRLRRDFANESTQ
jgi:hypothetical protein